MTCVPTHNELDWPRLEPGVNDFAAAMRAGGRIVLQAEPKKGKVFKVATTMQLPKALGFTPKNLKQQDRSAGTSANMRASAASAFLLANSPTLFVNAPMAWTGE